jgi:hypothetical protein
VQGKVLSLAFTDCGRYEVPIGGHRPSERFPVTEQASRDNCIGRVRKTGHHFAKL